MYENKFLNKKNISQTAFFLHIYLLPSIRVTATKSSHGLQSFILNSNLLSYSVHLYRRKYEPTFDFCNKLSTHPQKDTLKKLKNKIISPKKTT